MTQQRQKKRTSLDALALQSGEQAVGVEEAEPGAPARSASARPVQQTVYLPTPVHEQLRRLAYEERVKMHDFLMEGLDLVFKKRGLKSIDELKKQG